MVSSSCHIFINDSTVYYNFLLIATAQTAKLKEGKREFFHFYDDFLKIGKRPWRQTAISGKMIRKPRVWEEEKKRDDQHERA